MPLGKKATVVLQAPTEQLATITPAENIILALAHADACLWNDPQSTPPSQAAKAHVHGVDIYLPLAGLIDLEKEIQRIEKELAHCKSEIQKLSGKLANKDFVAKAPEAVVAKERQKLDDYQEKERSLQQHLQLLQ